MTLGVGLQGNAKFNPDKLVWIGRVTPPPIAYLWHIALAKSEKDAIGKQIILAATRATSNLAVIPLKLNEFLRAGLSRSSAIGAVRRSCGRWSAVKPAVSGQ